MGYLDALIGPGPWLIMDGSTLALFTGLIVFCFVTIAISIIVALVVMWIRSGNETMQNEQESCGEKSEVRNQDDSSI